MRIVKHEFDIKLFFFLSLAGIPLIWSHSFLLHFREAENVKKQKPTWKKKLFIKPNKAEKEKDYYNTLISFSHALR